MKPTCPKCETGKLRFVGRVFDGVVMWCDTCRFRPIVEGYETGEEHTIDDIHILHENYGGFAPDPAEVKG